MALHFLAQAIAVPVLPSLLLAAWGGGSDDAASAQGAAAKSSGYLAGLRSLLEFCFMPTLGALSDRYGRKPVVSLGLFTTALSFSLLAVNPSVRKKRAQSLKNPSSS